MTQLTNEDLLGKLLEAISTEGQKIKQEINENIKKENDKLVQLLTEQNQQINALKTKNKELEEKYLTLDRNSRKNNVIIFGLEPKAVSGTNLTSFLIGKLNSILGINIHENHLNNLYALGSGENAPIKVEFVSYLRKSLLFKNVQKLKGSKIFLVNDMCKEDRADYKILQAHMKEARSRNLTANIRGLKLLVNGEAYTAEQLRNETSASNNPNQLIRRRESLSAPSSPLSLIKHPEISCGIIEDIDQVVLPDEKLLPSTNQPSKKKKLIIDKVGPSSSSSNTIQERRTRQNSITSVKK